MTLEQFRDTGWQSLLDLADWWVLVIDTNNSNPLFEVMRGSLFVFGNTTLPRLGWCEFKQLTRDDMRKLLASGVAVLTVENEDTFLVRGAE